MSIVREPDGLAMSSRNAYLSREQRARALCLSQGLLAARARFDAGARAASDLLGAARPPIAAAMDSVDYLTLADPETLAPVAEDGEAGGRALLAVAARIGPTRLLDNVVLGDSY
jgi:pantoate--beta-alanine ligase